MPQLVFGKAVQAPEPTFASTLAMGLDAVTCASTHQSLPTDLGVKDAVKGDVVGPVPVGVAEVVDVELVVPVAGADWNRKRLEAAFQCVAR